MPDANIESQVNMVIKIFFEQSTYTSTISKVFRFIK